MKVFGYSEKIGEWVLLDVLPSGEIAAVLASDSNKGRMLLREKRINKIRLTGAMEAAVLNWYNATR